MNPIELAERLGRWTAGRGPLPVLLAGRLRALIDEGELPPGEPLPADRAFAAAMNVGRSTVVTAYELLRLEERIVRRQGSGTRVAGAGPRGPRPTTSEPIFLHLLEPPDGVIPLACAAPGAPPPELAEAYARVLPALTATSDDIGYYPAGHPALRRAVADHYTRRGLRTGPERILITSGAQQALSLLAQALLAPGDRVLVEGPTYPGALEAFRAAAALPRALPTGLDGLAAAARGRRTALAYAITTFHNPTGAVLPASARRGLVKAAAAAGVPLIDDEALAGLGFPAANPPPPLAAYDDAVISVGSLSKSIWGGLRLGWVRGPEPLVSRLARLLAVHQLGGNVPAQLAAAILLPQLETLCARQAAVRQAGHDRLRAELARRLPGWQVPAVPGGQTLWVRLPDGDGNSFAQAALRHGVAVLPGGGLDVSGHSGRYLRLHFIAAPGQLSEAVRRLALAWHAYRPPAACAAAAPAAPSRAATRTW